MSEKRLSRSEVSGNTLKVDPTITTARLSHDTLPAGGDIREARLHQILAAMMAFRDGDVSVRLPVTWDGIEGRIAEAFNQTISHEESISREVKALSVSVGKEGRLKQRLKVSSAGGSWAIRTHSINTLIDDLV